jgi:hypothetical protein
LKVHDAGGVGSALVLSVVVMLHAGPAKASGAISATAANAVLARMRCRKYVRLVDFTREADRLLRSVLIKFITHSTLRAHYLHDDRVMNKISQWKFAIRRYLLQCVYLIEPTKRQFKLNIFEYFLLCSVY